MTDLALRIPPYVDERTDNRLRLFVRTITPPCQHEGNYFCVWCGAQLRPVPLAHIKKVA